MQQHTLCKSETSLLSDSRELLLCYYLVTIIGPRIKFVKRVLEFQGLVSRPRIEDLLRGQAAILKFDFTLSVRFEHPRVYRSDS